MGLGGVETYDLFKNPFGALFGAFFRALFNDTELAPRALIASLESFIFGASNQIIGFYSLLYCLARNPHVQEKMRAEIRGKMRKGKDKFVLSYCWAVILETLRYIPQLGLGAPHQTREDIVVDGYKIPRGIDVYPDVIGNLWSEEHWNRPETFQPQRFLDKGGCFNHEVQS